MSASDRITQFQAGGSAQVSLSRVVPADTSRLRLLFGTVLSAVVLAVLGIAFGAKLMFDGHRGYGSNTVHPHLDLGIGIVLVSGMLGLLAAGLWLAVTTIVGD